MAFVASPRRRSVKDGVDRESVSLKEIKPPVRLLPEELTLLWFDLVEGKAHANAGQLGTGLHHRTKALLVFGIRITLHVVVEAYAKRPFRADRRHRAAPDDGKLRLAAEFTSPRFTPSGKPPDALCHQTPKRQHDRCMRRQVHINGQELLVVAKARQTRLPPQGKRAIGQVLQRQRWPLRVRIRQMQVVQSRHHDVKDVVGLTFPVMRTKGIRLQTGARCAEKQRTCETPPRQNTHCSADQRNMITRPDDWSKSSASRAEAVTRTLRSSPVAAEPRTRSPDCAAFFADT